MRVRAFMYVFVSKSMSTEKLSTFVLLLAEVSLCVAFHFYFWYRKNLFMVVTNEEVSTIFVAGMDYVHKSEEKIVINWQTFAVMIRRQLD